MTDFVAFLTDGSVVNFVLLFVRLGAMFAFLPFFSSPTVFSTSKAAFALLVTILFYPMLPPADFVLTVPNVMLAVLTEIAFGFAAGTILGLVFAMLQYAGEQIAFIMGFSMANTMDPQTGAASPIVSQFLYMLGILVFLAFDGHHILILFLSDSLTEIPLGGFLFTETYLDYLMETMSNLFAIGLAIAFPFLALSLLSDIVFGMIMKTMPSFNLLVIGFPVKIAVSLIVMMAVLGSMFVVFKNEFMDVFNLMGKAFFG